MILCWLDVRTSKRKWNRQGNQLPVILNATLYGKIQLTYSSVTA